MFHLKHGLLRGLWFPQKAKPQGISHSGGPQQTCSFWVLETLVPDNLDPNEELTTCTETRDEPVACGILNGLNLFAFLFYYVAQKSKQDKLSPKICTNFFLLHWFLLLISELLSDAWIKEFLNFHTYFITKCNREKWTKSQIITDQTLM